MNHEMDFAVMKGDFKKSYLPWEAVKEGSYRSLLLRYWACSLRCYLCHAQTYAYLDEEGNRTRESFSVEDCERAIGNMSELVGWTRIQGGEPLLDYSRAIFTAKLCGTSLGYMEDHSPYENPRVIIQTNGLWLGRESEDKLNPFFEELLRQSEKSRVGRIVIELSIKGSNKEAAKLFSGKLDSDDDVLKTQIDAFDKLATTFNELLWTNTDRIAFYPVCGLGPRLDNRGFIPIESRGDVEYPLFHPDTWHEDFTRVIGDFHRILVEKRGVYADFVERHDNRIPMECMEHALYQKGWTSQINKREDLRGFLRDHLVVNKWILPKGFLGDLKQVPVQEADKELLKKVDDLGEHFYDAEPSNHYLFL